MTKIEKLAREMALAHLNKNRAASSIPQIQQMKPLTRIEARWWHAYGGEWIVKAKAADFSDYSI